MEEIGKRANVEEYLARIENFFYVDKIKYHEIMFIYKAEFINNEDKFIETPLKNIEGKEELEYKWIELKRLDEYNLLPSVIKKILKENKYPIHIINDEINNPIE